MKISEFDRAILTSRKLIADAQRQLEKAVKSSDWSTASTLESFINGMNQTLIVFEQARERVESE